LHIFSAAPLQSANQTLKNVAAIGVRKNWADAGMTA
jgi:hypothetical protein